MTISTVRIDWRKVGTKDPLGAFYKQVLEQYNRVTSVSEVVVSEDVSKLLQGKIRKAFEKEYEYLSKRKLDSSIAMYWLDRGPSEDSKLPPRTIHVRNI